jgi:hypothetical protein
VLSVGDDVQVMKTGDKVGRLVVGAIGIDAVDVTDPASGRIFKISLQ